MENRPEMLMSRCDDEDESASSAALTKAGLGLIRTWTVGPRVPTASTHKKGARGVAGGEGGGRPRERRSH